MAGRENVACGLQTYIRCSRADSLTNTMRRGGHILDETGEQCPSQEKIVALGKEREGRNKVLRSKGQCQCHSNVRRVKDERNTVMEHFCAHRMTQASVAPRRGGSSDGERIRGRGRRSWRKWPGNFVWGRMSSWRMTCKGQKQTSTDKEERDSCKRAMRKSCTWEDHLMRDRFFHLFRS